MELSCSYKIAISNVKPQSVHLRHTHTKTACSQNDKSAGYPCRRYTLPASSWSECAMLLASDFWDLVDSGGVVKPSQIWGSQLWNP